MTSAPHDLCRPHSSFEVIRTFHIGVGFLRQFGSGVGSGGLERRISAQTHGGRRGRSAAQYYRDRRSSRHFPQQGQEVRARIILTFVSKIFVVTIVDVLLFSRKKYFAISFLRIWCAYRARSLFRKAVPLKRMSYSEVSVLACPYTTAMSACLLTLLLSCLMRKSDLLDLSCSVLD